MGIRKIFKRLKYSGVGKTNYISLSFLSATDNNGLASVKIFYETM